MDAATIAHHLRALGGIARTSQLCRRGATRAQLARGVDRGTLIRVRHGVYTVPEADPSTRIAAAHGGELCCASALRRHGVWVLEDPVRLHVWEGPHARVHPHDGCRCTTHRDDGRSAFGVVSVVHALIQSAPCLGAEAFFAAFESAWYLGLLTRSDRALLRQGVLARYRYLVDIARPDAESGIESLLRLRLSRLGIRLDSQILIPGVGRVDFVLAGRIILEVDGRLNHEGPSQRHRDLVRDAETAAVGYETLRFDYALVVHDWPRVERAIVAALARTR